MMDFTAEDLIDVVDRLVPEILARHGFEGPPVDTLVLAQEAFGLIITEAEDEADARSGRFGPRPPRRPRRSEVILRTDSTDEARHAACARACARELIPTVLAKLGVTPGTENKSAQSSLVGVIAPRLLLPTKWYTQDARKLACDLFDLKARYPTVGYETLALRLLDLDEPCVVAVVDDGTVSTRRGNCAPAGKQLTPAEKRCLEMVQEHGEPQAVRRDEWTTHGWPIPTGPFHRIILRSVPDEL